ncbi:uncharacterized protein [Amphiura filiformis]|uniref:uncharacterized protein n=1 Tax=Amphiura filiformis TaxID=82378 RepID=UPI003B2127B5
MDLTSSSSYKLANHRFPSPVPHVNRQQHYLGLIPSPSIPHPDDSNHSSMTSSSVSLPYQSSVRLSNPIRRRNIDAHSYDSGIGTITQRSILERARSPAQNDNASIAQLPVRHSSMKGTQDGLLFPKYFIDSTSKCIMCKACGIFFSHNVFLRHLHDAYGKKVECYGQFIELAIDVPNKEQILAFQGFLTKLGRSQEATGVVTELHQQKSGSPARNANLQTPSKPSQAPPNTWTQDIQETVLASEKLLKETSDYLRTSAKKMQHRRKNSIQLKELPILSKDGDAQRTHLVNDKPNETVPVIKTQNPHRTSKKSLQNLFSSDQTSKKVDYKASLMSSNPKYDLPRSVIVKNSENTTSAIVNENIIISSDVHHDPAVTRHLRDSLQVGSLQSRPSDGSGDAKTSGDVVASRNGEGGDDGRMTTDELAMSRRSEFPPLIQEKKNDPVYILQTAQDLITLATQKIHQPQKQSIQDNDWYSRYQAEHTLRLKCEASIVELQGMLTAEQNQRRELEIQLRALRLQKS